MTSDPAARQPGDPSEKNPYRQPGPIFYIAVVTALAILVALGSWQVRRLEWKEGLIATIQSRIASEPKSLDEVIDQWSAGGDVDYQPVRLSGIFDSTREQHFLATHEGQPGWYLYTPLATTDGRMVIVNRGFVPDGFKSIGSRPWQAPAGPVELTGLARNPLYEKPGWVVPDNAPAANVWYWKDFPAMADAMGIDSAMLVPFFVDVSVVGGATDPGPVAGVTRVDLPNNHLQYVVTWFGLALVLAVIALVFVIRSRRGGS